MGLFKDLHNEVERLFVAVPDDKKGQILYKWPDINLRKGTKVIVNADEQALFVNNGHVIGTLGPGQYPVDANELPFLGMVIDWATGGNAYRAELYFVGTREYVDQYGGRIDDVQDPQTGMIVTLRTFGEYAVKVVDPQALVLNRTGTKDVADNAEITDWVDSLILKTMRPAVTQKIVSAGWPILGLSAHTEELEQHVLGVLANELSTYGLAVPRFGNFNVNLADEDQAALKGLAKDTAYTRLAGSFQGYAAGEALKGAGEGMAKGGAAAAMPMMIAGMGLGQQMQPGQQMPPPQVPPAPGFAGGGQGYAQQPGAMPQQPPAAQGSPCVSCGTGLPPGAKFCPNCGTQQPANTPSFCTGCGSQMAAGAKFCASCGTPAGGVAPAAAAPQPQQYAQPQQPPAPQQQYPEPPAPPAPPAPPQG